MENTQTVTKQKKTMMDSSLVSKQKPVKFQVKAPPGSNVFLVGSFNNWDPKAVKMPMDGHGIFAASMKLPSGRHEYKFVVNGMWQVDPQCPQWVPNSFGSLNSVIEVA